MQLHTRGRKGLWALVAAAVCYAVTLWWVHAAVRSPLSRQYFQQYVTLRCSAEHTGDGERHRSRERLVEVDRALRRCEDMKVEVDGAWGGLDGNASVRLKVISDGGATEDLEYYSVDVSPILGISSIRYGLSPALYYWNF